MSSDEGESMLAGVWSRGEGGTSSMHLEEGGEVSVMKAENT